MISQWISSMEVTLEALLFLVFQVFYLGVLIVTCVGLVALLCLPLIIAYCAYLDRKEAKAKRSSVDGAAKAVDGVSAC